MHTNKAPSLKHLQEAIQKGPNVAGDNSLRERKKDTKAHNLSFLQSLLSLSHQSSKAYFSSYFFSFVVLKTVKIIARIMISS